MKESRSELKICILTIGNELLQGRIINTNASYLARKLSIGGHTVRAIITVGDTYDDIAKAIDLSIKYFGCNTIITTGGLGPTPDDITLEAIAKFLGLPLVVNEEALNEIRRKYGDAPLTPERIKMAKMPKGAKPIPNPVGTAPGMFLKHRIDNSEIIIVSLPGVPKEMERMFEAYVEPQLIRDRVLIEGEIFIKHLMESELAPLIKDFMKKHSDVYIKSHPEGIETVEPKLRIYISFYVEESNVVKGIERCRELIEELIKTLREYSSKISLVSTRCSSAKTP